MQRGERLMVSLGSSILRGRDDVLADDADRQQDQLEEIRREPVDEDRHGTLFDRAKVRRALGKLKPRDWT